MSWKFILVLLSGWSLGLFGSNLRAQSLTLDAVSAIAGSDVDLDISVAGEEIQGFVVGLAWDASQLTYLELVLAGEAAAEAELFVSESPAPGQATGGVVIDAAPPFEGQTIGSGTIATLSLASSPSCLGEVSIEFTDGLNSPPLDNLLVIDESSIGVQQGLVLNHGSVTCVASGIEFSLTDAAIRSDNNLTLSPPGCDGLVSVRAQSSIEILGAVIAVTYNNFEIIAKSVSPGADAQDNEFYFSNLDPENGVGLIASTIRDFVPPFTGDTFGAGDLELFVIRFECVEPIFEPDEDEETVISFIEDTLGNPQLENIAVVGTGQTIGTFTEPTLILNNAIFTCKAVPPLPRVVFYCGSREGPLTPIQGGPGEEVEICFFYNKEITIGLGDLGNIQGYQLAIEFDCQLEVTGFDLEDSATEAIGAEFVQYSIDNDPNDGDGCELTVAVILDALPPFDVDGNQVLFDTLPGGLDPSQPEGLVFAQNIGCAHAVISPEAECEAILPVTFSSGVNGQQNLPVANLAVIDFGSFQDVTLLNCFVEVLPVPKFQRGDCNDDGSEDLADAIAILRYEFPLQFVVFYPTCLDACDANDDGLVNLADAIFMLNYVFTQGDPPPPPGPTTDGPDTTPDSLDCEFEEEDCPEGGGQ